MTARGRGDSGESPPGGAFGFGSGLGAEPGSELSGRKISFRKKDTLKAKKIEIAAGVVHEVPEDLEKVLHSNSDLLAAWNRLTPLARNEWICWVTIVKRAETRAKHLERLSEDILAGKKRPCCWPGCPHHRESAKKWFK